MLRDVALVQSFVTQIVKVISPPPKEHSALDDVVELDFLLLAHRTCHLPSFCLSVKDQRMHYRWVRSFPI